MEEADQTGKLSRARASDEEQVRAGNAPSFGLSTVPREAECTRDVHGDDAGAAKLHRLRALPREFSS
jgi:hypothetical protein